MNAGHPQNADQIAYWNGPGGQRWASRQAAQDIVLQPVLDLLIDRAAPKAGERVVDVGCGSGASSFALAAKVVPAGHVLGVDVSGPMLTRARQSAPQGLPVEFALADATVYPFARESFDLLASRFGVSFEQACHRLTTMQRPGEAAQRGVPFFFLRVDPAGNVSKRFSAAAFPFARFGGSGAWPAASAALWWRLPLASGGSTPLNTTRSPGIRVPLKPFGGMISIGLPLPGCFGSKLSSSPS